VRWWDGFWFISLVFLFSGSFKVVAHSQTAAMEGAKDIALPAVRIAYAATVEISGGLAMMAGLRVRIVARLWIPCLIPTTLMFHNFWAVKGMDRKKSVVCSLLNLGLMGGLLYIAEFGAGGYSVDSHAVKNARGGSNGFVDSCLQMTATYRCLENERQFGPLCAITFSLRGEPKRLYSPGWAIYRLA
jgi:putative oxidoreductase